MIKILLVEDNPEKAKKVIGVIQSEVRSSDYVLDNVSDIKSAKVLLYESKFDIIILDLVLPLEEDDKDPKAENGIQFLEAIYENPSINVPIHIIGLTGVSGLKPSYEQLFHKNLNHLIDYREDSYNWQDQLKNFIWRLIEKEKEFIRNRSATYNYDVAIITALEKELKAVKDLSPNWTRVVLDNDSTVYMESVFDDGLKKVRVIAASAPQMGMNAAAALSMKLIYNFRPRYLIMTGIAASTKTVDSYGFGDVLVIDQSWDGGAGKLTEDKSGSPIFQPSANYLRLDPDIKEKVRSIYSDVGLLRKIKDRWTSTDNKPNTELQVHIGPVVSVAGVTENQAVINEIRSHDRKLLGLEMETYGVYYSAYNCSNPKPTPISIKSISDFANTDKNDKYQEYASFTSAQFMYELMMKELQF